MVAVTTAPEHSNSGTAASAEAGKHRFRAANGAMITVAVDELSADGSRERALEIAKEAIAQVAAAQSRERPAPAREREAGCGDAFWSWAAPEEFRR